MFEGEKPLPLKKLKRYYSEKKNYLEFVLRRFSIRMIARGNSVFVRKNTYHVRGPIKIALDTSAMQVFATRLVSVELGWESWSQRDTIFERFYDHEVEKSYSRKDFYDSAFAICEAFRAGDLTPVLLDSIEAERAEAENIHYSQSHGPMRLDFDVKYQFFDFLDLVKETENIFRRLDARYGNELGKETAIPSKYSDLINHLHGKSHRKDLIHLIACDVGSIDIFLTLDGTLKRPFMQYQKRKNIYKLGVKVVDFQELCGLLSITPIPIPLAKPKN